MLYMVHVYNYVAKFWDKYLVQAEDKEDAAYEAKRRLDEETDERSKAYLVYDIDKYPEY